MIITRFAPSPTGRLHLGHAYSAVLGHARARESGGKFLLRIEDLDPDALPAGVRRRHLSRICAGSGSIGTSRCWSSRSARPPTPAALERSERARAGLSPASAPAPTSPQSLTAPHGDAGGVLSRHLPRPARRSGSAGRPRRTAGGSIRRRRWPSPACPGWTEATGEASPLSPPTSATRFSPARTRLPPTICPASSTMRRAA